MTLPRLQPYQVLASCLPLAAAPAAAAWLAVWPGGLALAAAPAQWPLWPLPLVFAAMTAAAVCLPVQIAPSRKLTMQEPVHFCALLLFGPPLAMVAAVVGVLTGHGVLMARGRRTLPATLFNSGKAVLAIAAAGAVYYPLAARAGAWAAAGPVLAAPFVWSRAANALALPLAAAAMFAVETWLPCCMAGYQLRQNPVALWLAARRRDLPQMVALYAVAVAAAAIAEVRPWTVLVMVVPTAPIYLSLKRTARFLDAHLDEQTVAAVAAMADAVDQRLPHTAEHSKRVARIAEQVARAMGLPETGVRQVRQAARVHDLGMIGVPEDVLAKPGPLTPAERALVDRHVQLGYEMLERFAEFEQSKALLLLRRDPWTAAAGGAADADLRLGAQIIGVADAWDALTSARPYRPALTPHHALAELRRSAHAVVAAAGSGAGRQWHPDVVAALEALVLPAPAPARRAVTPVVPFRSTARAAA
jgi:HD-GYP domain-containing protein (c-di-GMP phosphodiesterase class II)